MEEETIVSDVSNTEVPLAPDVEPTPQQQQKQLTDYLKDFAGSPSPDQVDKWKATHGEVFTSGFSETELYIWRTLKRPEWIELQRLLQEPKNGLDQFSAEEYICNKCLLWKSTTGPLSEGKAGTVSTLYEQISNNSNFLNPQVSMMLVSKL